VQKLTALRHKYPILRRTRFLTGTYNEELGVKDLTWINASGEEMKPEEWADMSMECFGMLMDGRAQPTGILRRGEDATLLMVLNGYHDLVAFTLPETVGGWHWQLLIDTNLPEDAEMGSFATGETYGVTARSLLLFALESDAPSDQNSQRFVGSRPLQGLPKRDKPL
jgi:isoamylase